MPFDKQTSLASSTGAELNLYVREAAGHPRAVVQINHGLAEHAARYARFADFLNQRGFHVYAHDHRGHGATKAPDAPLGKFADTDGIAKVIADVDAVHDLIATEHPGLPVIVFGHSLGASVALNFVLRHSGRVHAAAIWKESGISLLPLRPLRNAEGIDGVLLGLWQAAKAGEVFRLHGIDGEKAGHRRALSADWGF